MFLPWILSDNFARKQSHKLTAATLSLPGRYCCLRNPSEKRPPWLVKQPPREIIFLPKQDIRVPCRAEGQPRPQ